ncbi:MAG: DUF2891 domain-containing protein [Sphingomonadales bacterium]
MTIFTPELAMKFAEIALGHVTREYPNKLDHTMVGDADARIPRDLHPVFFGSYDWHSCVHGYWLLLRLRRMFPDLPFSARITALAGQMLTPEKLEAERAYLDRPSSRGFERPYGWAWALALHLEASKTDQLWAFALEPLARAFAARFVEHLPKLTYPIRAGAHGNTAFAMILAREWADEFDLDLLALIDTRIIDWFADDRDCPGWEPGGDEFLSAAMVEALCMHRVLDTGAFRTWFDAFLPRAAEGKPASLFTPAFVSDPSDGKIAHLDGFNLVRAWCWRSILPSLNPVLAERAQTTAKAHLEASLSAVAGDYMGEHWLATFALLALETPD